ncbi:MAG: transketolase [Bacteroidales bacterium]|jgi:transketolase|nr:transketolase [Bacteroidales bacterium]
MIKNVNERAADNIRILSMAMVEKANSGHPGGAMGGADFIHILYSEFLRFDPADPQWINRDRFFLDPGHMSPMLYSVLTLTGLFTVDDIMQFRQWGSVTPGHPELDVKRGVENTSGPLGQGHTMAVGAAIAERFLAARFGRLFEHRIYAYISDGGIQEEISQGAGRLAGHLGLSNLIMFYDSNDIQLSTETSAVTSEDTAAKYRAWGWRVMEIDGHSHDQIRGALRLASDENVKPVLIIGKTVMGKGLIDEAGNRFEGKTSTHGQPVTHAGASFKKSVANLGGDPENPFAIFSDVKKLYEETVSAKKEAAEAWKEKKKIWADENPGAARLLESFWSGAIPEIDFSAITQKENDATRNASAVLLSHFAEKIPNMIVASADLANSDKTDGFLRKSKPLSKGDFSGAFLHAGVSELTMAAVMNGMALHGGVIPVCGTFFVFSDYMKPAVRLAALMGLPVKYVWTHDAFRVGEDGPTHQPVEQEAQIRLMEHLKNHHGGNSMLVLRPADAIETNIAWKLALENKSTPTALILSRQNIKTLPATGTTRAAAAALAAKGAYTVAESDGKPDVIMVASGSEVATLVEAASLLSADGVKTRIVSAPSEGLFRLQEEKYRNSVITPGIPVFCLTAGLPVTMLGFAGADGKVWGLESFGFSAAYGVLDQKLGFTGENVAKEVRKFLGR